jgi:hypothetical protein
VAQKINGRNFTVVASMLKRLFFTFFCLTAQAKPVVQLSVDPGRSMNGESVLFKIKIVNDSETDITAPQMPLLTDWEIGNSFQNASRTVRIINGNVNYIITTEFSYILRPLRTGLLKIPSLLLGVGNETYKTAATSVQVDRLSGGLQQRARNKNTPAPPRQDEPEDQGIPGFTSPLPLPSNNAFDFEAPDRESFFVRGEPSKRSVYQGELIVLPYSLYQRQMISMSEPGISRFPDFKGFLKEELEIKRDFTPAPFELKGEMLYRAELIKFAIFPLKPGRLRIEPLKFKVTMMPSQQDLFNSIMSGQMPMGDGIPMEKSSQEIIIDAKPLPPLPANSSFTGAVGQFQLDLKGPNGKLQVDQPFSMTLTLAGRGNVKAIEEPTLPLPKSLELNNTRTQYEFRADASGYKSFEYLVLPRSAGKLRIESFDYLYFDPATQKYQTLKTEPLELTIEGASASPAIVGSVPNGKNTRFSNWRSGPQEFAPWKKIMNAGFVAHPAAWATQSALYALMLFAFWRRRAQQSKTAFFKKMPWQKTAEIIRSKGEWDNKELALLVDQWIRERMSGALQSPLNSLHSEAPRDDFYAELRNVLTPEFHKTIEPLRNYWSELDTMRFTGARSSRAKTQDLFDRAQRIAQHLLDAQTKSSKKNAN